MEQPDFAAAAIHENMPAQRAARTWKALLAPLLAPLRPNLAGAWVLAAPLWMRVLLVLLGCMAIGVAFPLAGLIEATMNAAGRPEAPPPTLGDVWSAWHARGWFGDAELFFVAGVAATALLLAFAAWTQLAHVHVSGAVAATVGRLCCAIAGVLPAIAVVVISDMALVRQSEIDARLGLSSFDYAPPLIAASVVLVAVWISRAALAARPAWSIERRAPICEGCGYDLSHQPMEARCPECGRRVADSVLAGATRRNVRWELRPRASQIASTAAFVLLRPGEFYSRLHVHTAPQAADAFCRAMYVLLAIVAFLWFGAMEMATALLSGPGTLAARLESFLSIAPVFAMIAAVVCWFGHCVGASIMATLWAMRREVADFRPIQKIAAYESAYLWVFCGTWAALVTLFILTGRLLTQATIRLPLGVRPGVAIFLLTTIALAAVWAWRYRVARCAVRWSNF